MKINPKLVAKARRIRLVLMDVDGVLTDGRLFHFVDSAGRLVETKGIHAHDSIALAWLAQAGLVTGLISGRISEAVEVRAKELKMSYIYQHRTDKKNVLDEIMRLSGFTLEQIVFIGDDMPDVPVIKVVGLGVAVQNARPQVKAVADWVTRAQGGQGAVREVAELILAAQGHWKAVLDRFS